MGYIVYPRLRTLQRPTPPFPGTAASSYAAMEHLAHLPCAEDTQWQVTESLGASVCPLKIWVWYSWPTTPAWWEGCM